MFCQPTVPATLLLIFVTLFKYKIFFILKLENEVKNLQTLQPVKQLHISFV